MIKNYTPHEIRIIKEDACEFIPTMRKYILREIVNIEDATIAVIPPEGKLLNAKFEDIVDEPIDGIPTLRRKLTAADPLPEGDFYCVVSALYASACNEKSRLLTVGDVVYTPDGRTPIGCLRLIRA